MKDNTDPSSSKSCVLADQNGQEGQNNQNSYNGQNVHNGQNGHNGNGSQNGITSKYIILVENCSDWKEEYPELKIVKVNEYLSKEEYFKLRNIKVINLCKSYKYLSRGYFCSLLAEARKHKIIPSVKTLNDLSTKAIYKIETEDLDDIIYKSFHKIKNKKEELKSIEIHIYFGVSDYLLFDDLAEEIFDTFRCPLMKVEFEIENGKWQLSSLKPLTLNNIPEEKIPLFIMAVEKYTSKRWITPRIKTIPKYNLAILNNFKEKLPPSNKKALKKFIKVGKTLDIYTDMLQKKDYARLAEYDALFIRETTAIDHYTYRFAKKAASEGMAVIDDPDSILKCTNKVYLAELLMTNKIPAPKSAIFGKDMNVEKIESQIPYPIVIKIPDGSFSRGIFKARNREELIKLSAELFDESDIILAQEFMYTDFDWRIGIINKTPLFASKYFMSKEHWQVYNHNVRGRCNWGSCLTMPVEKAPQDVVNIAIKAANLIGDGLYGVDLKETERGVVVIEVNDNPNIESGYEDTYLKDELYRIILKDFIRRIENIKK